MTTPNSPSLTDSKKKIAELIERFRHNADAYKNGIYNETQVRREFIDPFFEALGWDISNKAGYAEQYKDVVHEDSIKVGVSLKAPDYSFRVGGQRKFFLEAKKPSVKIKEDVGPAYQLRRYAWSAKLPLSILTDFEELAVYDCRNKPDPNDKASVGRIAYYTYDQYLDKFDDIYGTFSKEEVYKGSFDRYAESSKGKKGTGEVDREFLKEIEKWRDSLAKNLALRNPELDIYELNFAVQHTIDRIIFLRICEDRGIEGYGRLQGLLNGASVYERLLHLFTQADQKYNSGLFDFKTDRLSHNLNIDDKVLKEIVENLYYPKSPYEFSVLGADILGNVYEQFLGKVIRLTSGHQAKVDEKPEVKKAGGVFYTPQYIVEYIVKNTVGKLIEGKTPKQVSNICILDPACGSGSFLIGAYQHLLEYHLKWYRGNDPEKHAKGKTPALYIGAGKEWRLTTQEKKRILLNNIYGVDIDRQAVEVTKLSLLLKVLEDENQETIGKNLSMFHERILPSLENNIKCGNSLIGPDFYNSPFPLFSKEGVPKAGAFDDDIRRINVFDWEKEFSEIMKTGGFDVVIGNPPYVRQEMLGEFKPYLQSHYKTYHGMADLYVYFIEKAVSLLNEGGHFSYIVANKWMRANYGEPLRRWMKEQRIEEIVDFGDLPVFQTATTYPCILRIQNPPSPPFAKGGKEVIPPLKKGDQGGFSGGTMFHVTKVHTLDFLNLQEYVNEYSYKVSSENLDDGGWSLSGGEEEAILAKIKTAGVPLGEYVNGKIYRGVLTGLNEAFVIDSDTRNRLIAEDPKSEGLIKPFLLGRDVKRYQPLSSARYLIFTRRGIDIKQYPAIERYLSQFKEQLMPKHRDWQGTTWKGRKPGTYKWYEIQDAVDYYGEFENPKIIYPEIATKGQFTLDSNSFYSETTTYILGSDSKYLLGILNSRLWTYLFSKISSEIRGGFYRWKRQYMSQLPIVAANKTLHDKMVSLIDRMLDLNKKLQSARIAHEKELIGRQIKITDEQIDQLVYELYGLTEEEIGIVEGE